ncbi:hypothetical protein HZH66_010489 [Vespula vulgaris]|uniref:Uncharacterized protein n=1 Tax=Vespula vulgaris TaxID=7454 RepID=A0A834JLL0_VESVU|nr:hypothetical protein HZH66_010489 [Vespula vulgaris]
MAQNDNLKLFINKSDKNYTINNQSIIQRLETWTGLMDIDNPNTKHDATKKCKFNISNSYLSLFYPVKSYPIFVPLNQDEPDERWLSKIPASNSFNKLQEIEVLSGNDRMERNNPQPKRPPIHIEAQVITSDTYRKVTKLIKEKKANFYTYQPKKDRSYKVVLRGMHSRTDTGIIIDELKKMNR